MYHFYKIFFSPGVSGRILYDVNLRNFLLNHKGIVKVDFEDCRRGTMEGDIGKMAAFILTYDPIFTDFKKDFAADMINEAILKLKIDKEQVISEYIK